MTSFQVVTLHTDGEHVSCYADPEEAAAYAQSTSPEIDGSMMPNLPESVIASHGGADKYERGFFWLGNRYAVLFNLDANYESPL